MENNTLSTYLKVKKPRLSGNSLKALKEKLRRQKKNFLKIPRFRLLGVGECANISVNVQDRIPIFLKDIQHLLLYCVMGNKSPYLPDRWCKLEKYNQVKHTIVCILEGLSLDHYVSNQSIFQHLTSKLDYGLELITPAVYGGSIIEELVAVPLTGIEKSRLLRKFGSIELALEKNQNIVKLFKAIFPLQTASNVDTKENVRLPATDKFPRTELLLSPYQLIEENYPIPLKGGLAKKYENYVMTKDTYAEVNSESKMYGIDCEMCRTTLGSLELTRISIVDEALNVVYDTLVKPDNKITDYLTPYSGITKDMLEKVTTRLSDVQDFIRIFLPADAIIVGQSLNSDFNALKMMHPYIIDTAVIFNVTGDRYRKTKLKVLASTFLNENIQNNKAGHCSAEDATASLKLVQLKLANSIDFGDSILIEKSHFSSYMSELKKDKRTMKSKYENCNFTVGSSIFNRTTNAETGHSKTAGIFGCTEVMNNYSKFMKNSNLKITYGNDFQVGDHVRLVISESNRELVKRCSQVAAEHALSFLHVTLNNDDLAEDNVAKTLHSVDKWIEKLWKHTKQYGMLCVLFSGKKNSSTGACFLSIKNEINTEDVSKV
ncbi:RNA exonuclease 5 isoform X1 [Copidosoma floridanum]|uniref:RNA exonuclease 5 isoform X1 n=1 Tax=Copidosoma floridanum TaxID=29053 RepID=UPI0006C9DB42|nr:RNA exonuclease 5 isoform X1 [Copidosoma floridanum]